MAQKNNRRTPPPEHPPMPQTLRESAQQIWMAGLSAFAKAQSGGNKVFEALMKEGEALQSRTRQAARDQVDDMAEKASGTWDKLEQVFETRVARALHTLGVPTHEDIDQLSRRVAELTALVDRLQAGGPAASGAGIQAEPKPVTQPGPKPGSKSAPKPATKATHRAAKPAAKRASSQPPIPAKKTATTASKRAAVKKTTAKKTTIKKAAD